LRIYQDAFSLQVLFHVVVDDVNVRENLINQFVVEVLLILNHVESAAHTVVIVGEHLILVVVVELDEGFLDLLKVDELQFVNMVRKYDLWEDFPD